SRSSRIRFSSSASWLPRASLTAVQPIATLASSGAEVQRGASSVRGGPGIIPSEVWARAVSGSSATAARMASPARMRVMGPGQFRRSASRIRSAGWLTIGIATALGAIDSAAAAGFPAAAEMVGKIKAAVDTRQDADLVIIARSDARAIEGLDAAIDRVNAYLEAGADVGFVEAPQTVDELRIVGRRVAGPALVNVFE